MKVDPMKGLKAADIERRVWGIIESERAMGPGVVPAMAACVARALIAAEAMGASRAEAARTVALMVALMAEWLPAEAEGTRH